MSEFRYKLPTELIIGSGAITNLPEICSGYGKSLLFIYPVQVKHLAKPCIDKLTQDGFGVTALVQENPEPTITYINDVTLSLQQNNFDLVIGFGGGSSIDLAKSLAISLTQSDDIWMYANLSDRPPLPLLNPVLPIIAIPTTSGTG